MEQHSHFLVPTLGKKEKGRPCTHWVDELRKQAGPDWPTKAKDRSNWKGLVKMYAHSWVDEGVKYF